ncbi:hypothetical protein DMENIID0001_092790 [Sergentomyia squamirostris]
MNSAVTTKENSFWWQQMYFGSLLGPLLFSMFINDLPPVLRNCRFHLYADDLQIYVEGDPSDPTSCFKLMNEILADVEHWASSHGLEINPKKSQAIVIHKRSHNIPTTPLFINNEPIPFVENVKNLGIIFNSHLTWSDHVSLLCRKVHGSLFSLRRFRDITPYSTKLLLARSLLIHFFTYGAELIYAADSDSMRHMSVAFNNIVRYVCGLGPREHVSARRDILVGCDLPNFLKMRVVTFIWRLLQSGCPDYLFSLLERGASSRISGLLVPGSSCDVYRNSLFVSGVSLFNSLPRDARASRGSIRGYFLNDRDP